MFSNFFHGSLAFDPWRNLTRGAAGMLLVLAGVTGISQSISAAEGKLVNLSTRALVGTGEEVMIGGFIVQGGARQVLIQARGPELVNDGISNALADPVLTIIQTSEGEPPRTTLNPPIELMVNDNWEDSQRQLVFALWGGNPNLAEGSLSSAAVLALEPGGYTAMVEGKDGTSGVALVEVYEVVNLVGIGSPEGRLVNLSTRALVGTGEEVMIGGFIIDDDPQQVLIQALGPELADRGISKPLADPVLTVTNTTDRDPNNHTQIIVNDDWEDSQGRLISDLWGGNPPLTEDSLSSAVVLTLDPGNYTAKVEGKDGASGVAIVEVYGIESPDTGGPEREALVALYDAMDGANWTRSDNWDTDAPLERWYGVELDDNGQVIELDLSNNQLSGTIPAEIANLTHLEELSLDGNQLRGPIPPEIGNLANLEDLWLYDNELSGMIPPEIGNLANLENLSLDGNQLSGPIPSELGDLTNLEGLWLFDNQLIGPIPPELGRLTNLEYLSLRQNQLSGPIPPELGNLANLESLWLYDNELSGTIPPELGNLTNLEDLSLRQNQLSGVIPPELGDLANLEGLWLYDNELSGTIPPEIGNLANLITLNLHTNQLSGTIPGDIGNLTNLEVLSLDDNQLSGPIPA